jgi:hypothetical protein
MWFLSTMVFYLYNRILQIISMQRNRSVMTFPIRRQNDVIWPVNRGVIAPFLLAKMNYIDGSNNNQNGDDYLFRFIVLVLLFSQMFAANEVFRDGGNFGHVYLVYGVFAVMLPILAVYFSADGEATSFVQDSLEIFVYNFAIKSALLVLYFSSSAWAKFVFNNVNNHITTINWTLFALIGCRMAWLCRDNWPIFGVLGVLRTRSAMSPTCCPPSFAKKIAGYFLIALSPLIGYVIDIIPIRKGFLMYFLLLLIIFLSFLFLQSIKSRRRLGRVARARIEEEKSSRVIDVNKLQAQHEVDRAQMKMRAIEAEQARDNLAAKLCGHGGGASVTIRLDGTGNPVFPLI